MTTSYQEKFSAEQQEHLEHVAENLDDQVADLSATITTLSATMPPDVMARLLVVMKDNQLLTNEVNYIAGRISSMEYL